MQDWQMLIHWLKELKGPFDFVFSDADKDWYKNYFIDVDPKLKVGGCFTAHNISDAEAMVTETEWPGYIS